MQHESERMKKRRAQRVVSVDHGVLAAARVRRDERSMNLKESIQAPHPTSPSRASNSVDHFTIIIIIASSRRTWKLRVPHKFHRGAMSAQFVLSNAQVLAQKIASSNVLRCMRLRGLYYLSLSAKKSVCYTCGCWWMVVARVSRLFKSIKVITCRVFGKFMIDTKSITIDNVFKL